MLVGAVAVLITCLCVLEIYAWYSARNLPPGVSGLRCLFYIPRKTPWLKILEFNRKYGDIASCSLCGFNVVVIGSAKIAKDLLDKHGVRYADRPRSVMAGELAGWGKMMLLCNYTDRFHTQRKWIAHDIGSHAAVAKFHRMIEGETRRTLRLILRDPERLQAHIHKNFSSMALRLSHGYVTKEEDDPLVNLVQLANSQLSSTTTAGAYYVDILPFLRHVPGWVPGAGFKKLSAEYAIVTHSAADTPHHYAVSQLAAGTALPSLSSRLLSTPDLTEEMEDEIKWTSLTLNRGGVNTASILSTASCLSFSNLFQSSAVASAFFLAMTLYPLVMKRAQQELDSVIGTGQLPTFADRPSLPYVEAVCTELLRWHAPAPITMRCTAADDVYEGYLIPANSYVLVNVWAMLRDEKVYKNPSEFRPERFLGDNPEPHPTTVCFGFGRRRCPGIFFAHSALWLICTQSLAAFNISKAVKNGAEITPEFRQEGGTFLDVAPFECLVKPRSEAARHLITEAFTV